MGEIPLDKCSLDRMNEINETPSQSGETVFSPTGYDIAFEHVSFAYNSGETVTSAYLHCPRTPERRAHYPAG